MFDFLASLFPEGAGLTLGVWTWYDAEGLFHSAQLDLVSVLTACVFGLMLYSVFRLVGVLFKK